MHATSLSMSRSVSSEGLQNQMKLTSHFNGFGTNLAAFCGLVRRCLATTTQRHNDSVELGALARCFLSDFGTGTLPLLPIPCLGSTFVGEPVYRGPGHGDSLTGYWWYIASCSPVRKCTEKGVQAHTTAQRVARCARLIFSLRVLRHAMVRFKHRYLVATIAAASQERIAELGPSEILAMLRVSATCVASRRISYCCNCKP